MKTLTYAAAMNASRSAVWDAMVDPEKYKQWAKGFSPESQFDGEWRQGTQITFFDPNLGGTRAVLEIVEPERELSARHVAIFGPDRKEDTESEAARKWIGTTEHYDLSEADGRTRLVVRIECDADFVDMFNASWPTALELLKAVAEKGG
jgi:hypothetical protein